MHVADLTSSQLESYHRIWGSFTDFDWSFVGPRRTFGFYGRLNVAVSGRIDVLGLCVGCSQVGDVPADTPEMAEIRNNLLALSRESEASVEVISGNREATATTHIVLTYRDSDGLFDVHLERCEPKETEDPLVLRNEYYPVSEEASPSAARCVPVKDLERLLPEASVVVMTGAGISTGSGIPSFRGPEGLEKHFPLQEPFPGAVAHIMVDQPDELVRTLGRFQAAFIQAEPNPAHLALAHLEKIGIVRHVITGNGDKLHERAGSRNVHLKSARYFVEDGEGWKWLSGAGTLLAIGLGRDEHGLISYCRDRNVTVVAISPNRPEFLHEKDLFVEGKAEDVLPELCVAGAAN